MSVKRKLNIKSLGKKCQALKDLDSALSNKKVVKFQKQVKARFNIYSVEKINQYISLLVEKQTHLHLHFGLNH